MSDAALDSADGSDGSTLPSIACLDQAIGGAFFFTRAAAKTAMTPGGTPQAATYRQTFLYDGNGGNVSGSATVFSQGSDIFFRFYFLPSGGTAVRGTKWFKITTPGNATLVELCAAGKIGTTEAVTYEMRTSVSPNVLLIDYGARQERFEVVP